jgi:TRAP-type C4-dicarboxylate transport system substrate-binding protein
MGRESVMGSLRYGRVAVCALTLAVVVSLAPIPAALAVELKLGHVAPTDNPYHQAAQRFAELVSERTKKAVTVRIFSNAQLGNERDLIEGLQIGTVQMTIAANAPISRYSPKVLLFDLPFLFRDDAHWDKVVDGPIGKEVGEEFI